MGVVASEYGIRRLTLPERTRSDVEAELGSSLDGADRDPAAFAALRQQLDRYFSGEPEDLSTVPIDLDDPEFFAAARAACRTIPAGETRTYSWLAEVAGRPGASRAAGQAMARNPVPLLVPCHRVVGSDGQLHGFGGGIGLPLKARLLELEGHRRNPEGRQLSLTD